MRLVDLSKRAMRGTGLHCVWLLLAFVGLAGSVAAAQVGHKSAKRAPASSRTGETVSALMLSDIHFDPFFDPGKVAQLAAAPVSGWEEILAGEASKDRDERWAALKKTCPARGEDSSFALLESSLAASHENAMDAKFATVSGDLIAHAFKCKFESVMGKPEPGEYRAFVVKTIEFVKSELTSRLPGVPLFIALGNNDSDCGDYQLDAKGEFLSAIGPVVTGGLADQDRLAAQETFAAGGYYSVQLPAPIRNSRLLVLDDVFMSARYSTCGGKPDGTAADEQIAWLEQQLAAARSKGEKVWVMGHIPPGVDLYTTMAKMDQVCGGKGPKMFLSSEKLADTLVEFSDVVDVAIFAHSHMDEVRVLRVDGQAGKAQGKIVAVKIVPSISPVSGNAPAFTVARVEARSGALGDFKVFKDSGPYAGRHDDWREEYDWGKTYHQTAFSAAAVSNEIAAFKAEDRADGKTSRDYLANFSAGRPLPLMELVWPQYLCSVSHDSAQAFEKCVCSAGK